MVTKPLSNKAELLNRIFIMLSLANVSEAVYQRVHDLNDLLQEWGLSDESQLAAHLFPIAQKPDVNEQGIIEEFGERPLYICKVAQQSLFPNKTKSLSPRMALAEHLRKCYKLAYTDKEVALFILANRLVSLGDIDTLNDEGRSRWAEETCSHYLPVFELFGLQEYATALRDVSLRILNKPLYHDLECSVDDYYTRHQWLVAQFLPQLSELLKGAGVRVARLKAQDISPANLSTPAHPYASVVSTLPTHLHLDVILDQDEACYVALGAVHRHWKPIKLVQDGLGAPAYNGYRALTTTIDYGDDIAITLHIRTTSIEKANTYGILSGANAPKTVWWNMPNTVGQKINTPEDPIGVFTPDGRWVYPLRQGVTVVDFAFRIHSELGAYARNFWVNGKPTLRHYPLRHGDLVEIDFDRQTPHITADWLSAATLSKTRRHIKNFLKRHSAINTEITSHQTGRMRIETVLERETAIYRLRFSTERLEEKLKRWAMNNGFQEIEALYQAVEMGNITADEVVCALIEAEFAPHVTRSDGTAWATERIRFCRCWMMAEESVKWTIASRIAPNTPIVGRIVGKGRQSMLMVHRADCLNAPAPDDAIQLGWRTPNTHESAEVVIHAPFKTTITSQILYELEALQQASANDNFALHRFQSDTNTYQTTITFTISSDKKATLVNLEQTLRALQTKGDIMDFSFWGLFHSERLHLTGKFDKRQQNPYTLKQIRDQAMFFGREHEIKRVVDYLKDGETFIVLYGQKRIGKTSLMEHLASQLPRTADVLPVFYDSLSLVPFNAATLLRGLVETALPLITRAIKRATLPHELRLRPQELQQDPFGYFAKWAKRVEDKLGGKRLLFMIDEFTRAEEELRRGQIDESFFNGLQWLVGNQHICFFICVHDHIYRQGSQSGGFLQRGNPIYLPTLDRRAATKLIQLPLKSIYQFDEEVVNEILSLTNGHPYFTQAVCLKLSSYMASQEETRISLHHLHTVITLILREGKHYFNHFYAHLDETTKTVLKTIANLCEQEDVWVTKDAIQEAMETVERFAVAESIGILYQSGVIEARKTNITVTYRIPIRLFEYWLRHLTHPLIDNDIYRK